MAVWTWQYRGHLPVCHGDVTLHGHRGKGNGSATLKPQVIINSIARSAPKVVAELSLLLKKIEALEGSTATQS